MSAVGSIGGRGFMRAGLGFPQPGGDHRITFAVLTARNGWSDAGLELYFERRAIALDQARSHAAHGAGKLVLVDGVAFSTPRSDKRPGWEITAEAAVDLLTAQVTLLAHELSGRR